MHFFYLIFWLVINLGDGLPVEEKQRKHVKDMVLYDLLGLEPEATQGTYIISVREAKYRNVREDDMSWKERIG